jgi:hypothetical protein
VRKWHYSLTSDDNNNYVCGESSVHKLTQRRKVREDQEKEKERTGCRVPSS